MTEATKAALNGLRDLSTLQWYVIPLLAIVFYIYAKEIRKARKTRNWDAVLCGATILGLDFFNETWNGWVMVLTGRSAFWTARRDQRRCGPLVGWNIEITVHVRDTWVSSTITPYLKHRIKRYWGSTRNGRWVSATP